MIKQARRSIMRHRRPCSRMLILMLVLILVGLAALHAVLWASSVSPRAAKTFIRSKAQVVLGNQNGVLSDLVTPSDELYDGSDDEDESESPSQSDKEIVLKPKKFDYREIFSRTTQNRKYFPIHFGSETAYNPNIIPHPKKHDMWIIVAQHEQSAEEIRNSEQLACTAGFYNGVLLCSEEPTAAPIADSKQGKCEGDMAYINFRSGPRDARMFYGPHAPYLVYGSQSEHTCLGLWLQDARMLLEPFRLEKLVLVSLFKQSTELRRPPPVKAVEKNYFLFWDNAGKAYAHYDLWPNRAFAQLDADGSFIGSDLAPAAAASDLLCMSKFMPEVGPKQESIHQATNTLSITMCNRSDPTCKPTDENTFIMHIFHHKTYYDFHGVYEPYVILFDQKAPFAIHAISTRPFWIHGRSKLTKFTGSLLYKGRDEWIPEGHTEMFYITSISWKSHGSKYHGYLDDVIFIAFGIEDTRSGAIDVPVADLLQDLGLC